MRNPIYQYFLSKLVLDNKHLQLLLDRGFSDQSIRDCNFKSMPAYYPRRNEIAKDLYQKFGEEIFTVPGFFQKGKNIFFTGKNELIIPSRNILSEVQSLTLRKDVVSDKEQRYTHFSCKDISGVALNPAPHFPAGAFDKESFFLTEGQIKGELIGQYLNVGSACVSGVTMWRQFIKTVPFQNFKTINIAFDRDLEENKHVANACLSLFKFLISKEINTQIVIWNNDFKGIDDAITKGEKLTYLNFEEAQRYLDQVYYKQSWGTINWENKIIVNDENPNQDDFQWNKIRPLPKIFLQAPELNMEIIPEPLRDWIKDASYRMQGHSEFIFCTLITLFSSMLGRCITIKPKQHDNWQIVPNLWGMLVGEPSAKKSPCLAVARKFIDKIQKTLDEDYKNSLFSWRAEESSANVEIKSIDDRLKKYFKNKQAYADEIADLIEQKAQIQENIAAIKPVHKRLYVNDVTTEAFQEILADNPAGVANIRDELSGFLSNLDKMGRENDRAFYLECYNGSEPYYAARIGRGSISFFTCASIIGGIQPDSLRNMLLAGMLSGASNDGFTQRFQLIVWPSFSQAFTFVDQKPNLEAYNRIEKITNKIFEFRNKFDPEITHSVHFDTEAQVLFQEWLTALETRARSGEVVPPPLAAHILKYPKLMCSLSLIFEIVDAIDNDKKIEEVVITKKNAHFAIKCCEFFEGHALKIYSHADSNEQIAASVLCRKIIDKNVYDGMTIREIYRKGWQNLKTKEAIHGALNILEFYGWARQEQITTDGAPSTILKINPQVYTSKLLN